MCICILSQRINMFNLTMAFTVCTENPIENVKSQGFNSYLISFRYCMQKKAVDGNCNGDNF